MADEVYSPQIDRPGALHYINQEYKENRIIKSAESMMTKPQRQAYHKLRMAGHSKIQAIRMIAAQGHN